MKNSANPDSQKKISEPEILLANTSLRRDVVVLKKQEKVFSQGSLSDAVFYIQKGKIKLTVISKQGKEATIAILEPGMFLGEECITGAHRQRPATATTITRATVLSINREEMVRVLHQESAFSEMLVSYLLDRSARVQADLVDHLFNSSEKRLARALLILAQVGKDSEPQPVIPKISQAGLAEMIGTTRSRVSFFMNRFRKLGLIEYNGKICVHSSLLSVVLHE